MALASLTKLTEYVSSLLNAASWNIVLDGVTNGTTTLTSATALFATADKGKTISVSGAGVGGLTLLTTIASVTNATTIVMADAATSTAVAHVVSFGGRSYDPRHTEPVIQEAILQKDLEVCVEILNEPNHPQRANFTPFAPATVTNGTQVPAHTGVLSLVVIDITGPLTVFGIEVPFHKLMMWMRNAGVQFSTTREGYYAIDRNQLYYTGTSARVTGVLLTKTTACQAPVEYSNIIAVNAAADLFATEGDDLQASELFNKVGLTGYQRVGRGEQKRVI